MNWLGISVRENGAQPLVTIMDVAADHVQRQAYCGCSICWMAKMVNKQKREKAEADAKQALTERLMKEWP